MVYNFFNKMFSGSAIKKKIIPNQQLAPELYMLIIRNFGKRKVYLPFKVNIKGTDFVDMQLIRKYNKRYRFFIMCY